MTNKQRNITTNESTTEEIAAQAGILPRGESILNLEDGALQDELLPIIGSEKTGWYMPDSERLVEGLLNRLQDAAGNAADLGDQEEIIKLVLCPTEDRQRAALKRAFAAAGYVLDGDTEATFELLFNVPAFGDFLESTENPETGMAFIKKPVKGANKKKFAALITKKPTSAKAPVVEPAHR